MLIAEIGLIHDGSLGNALAFIDAVADAGADAVKFQCHDGDENTSLPESGCDLPQDSNRAIYWVRTSFVGSEWELLRDKAHSRNLKFGVTPFSLEALEKVAPLCDFIKISRNYIDGPLHAVADATKTLVLFTNPDVDTGLIECLLLNDYRKPYIGISDHSGTIWPCIRAAALGASIYEVHVTWDRRAFGPDQQYSLTINELKMLREGIDAVQQSG